jgi:cytochrome c oxidase subunit II
MNFPFLADINKSFWFPEAASTFADRVDTFYYIILAICIIFFVPIVVAMIYFSIKYRQRPGYKGSPEALHNNTIEVTWTVVPTLIVVWIFWEGTMGYLEMSRMPDDTTDVYVYARKWNWNFKYRDNGAESTVLYLPVNTKVKLIMQSKDVLHSFFIPAFRAKRDVVPGRNSYMWFEPTKEGEFDLFCTEYCGDNHSTMITKAVVLSESDYKAKLVELNKEPEDIVERGRWLYVRKSCAGCHYAGKEGSKVGPGPSYNGAWGKSVSLAGGGEVAFDEEYVKSSILNPAGQKRTGYENKSAMPSYKGELKQEQIDAIIEFIKSVKDEPPPS